MTIYPFSYIVGAVSGFAVRELADLALQQLRPVEIPIWMRKSVSISSVTPPLDIPLSPTKTVSGLPTNLFWDTGSSISTQPSVQSVTWLRVTSIISIIVIISILLATFIILYIQKRTRANSKHQEVSMTRVDESSGDTAKVSNQTSSEIVPNNFLIVCLRARVAELKTEVEKYKAFLNKFQISLDAASHHSELTLSMIPSATVSLSPVEASSTNIHETYCHTATQTHPAASSSSFTSTPADIAASETQKSGPVTVQSQTKEKQILREESMKEQLSHNRFLILATEENDDGDAESTTTAMPNPCETVTTMHSTPEPTSTDDHKEWIHPRRRRNMRRGGPNKGRHAPKTPNLGQNFDDASTAMGNPSMDVTVEKAVTSAVPEPVAKAKAN